VAKAAKKPSLLQKHLLGGSTIDMSLQTVTSELEHIVSPRDLSSKLVPGKPQP